MDVLVTVVDSITEATADVRIEADDDATAGPVLDALASAVGAHPHHTMWLDGRRLLPDARLIDCSLRSGDVVHASTVRTADRSSVDPETLARFIDRPAAVSTSQSRWPGEGGVAVNFPRAPDVPPAPGFPLLAAVAPLALGVVLAVLLRQWLFVAFAALAPVTAVAQALSDRRSRRRRIAAATVTHDRDTAEAEHRLAELLAAEADALRQEIPDSTGRLITLGRGSLSSRIVATGRPQAATVSDVPVALNVADPGVTVLTGSRLATRALARSLLLQVASRALPNERVMAVLAPGGGKDWAWCRWLPQLRCGPTTAGSVFLALDSSQIEPVLRRLADSRHPESAPPIVIADGVDAERLHGSGLCAGCHVVLLGTAEVSTATTTVQIDEAGRATIRDARREVIGVIAESASVTAAESVARILCRRADSDGARISEADSWVQLVDWNPFENGATERLFRRWQLPPTGVPIGTSAGHPLLIDLVADGPHMLIAGATGSGKSELLRTLAAGLAVTHPPDRLHLLLIDYKGGAAFGDCVRLPHVAALLTDLDEATTRRALSSLSAELRRREAVLAAAGVANFDEYDAASRGHGGSATTLPVLPRLVVIVDEFATLAADLPEFITRLIGVAQRGRSLGVHLVLATQRPHGSVSPEIRANTRLRICLAVHRVEDSLDVIDSAIAAQLTTSRPGDGYLKSDAGPPRLIRVARLATSSTGANARVTVSPVELAADIEATHRPAGPVESGVGPIIAGVTAAAALGDHSPAVPPWLPPLPDRLTLTELSRATPSADTSPPWARLDLPDRLSQPALCLSSAESLLIAGSPRSGRTTALLAAATAIVSGRDPGQLHCWAIDGGSSLAPMTEWPHCGAVIPTTDVDRVRRLVAHLRDQLISPAVPRRADMLLVVDTWDAFTASYAALDGGRIVDEVVRLASAGPTYGLRVLISAGRSGLSGRLAGAISERITLRLPDRADYAMVGLSLRDVPDHLPPGRGFQVSDGSMLQIAVADEACQRSIVATPAASSPPRRFPELPTRVCLDSARNPLSGGLTLGLDDDLRSVEIDPSADGGTLIITGPPRSGRTTLLRSLAHQLSTEVPIIAFCPPRSRLREQTGVVTLPLDDEDDALAQLEAMGPRRPHVLIDDIELIGDSRLSQALQRTVMDAQAGHRLVALAGHTQTFAAAFRGPAAQARQARLRVLLRPGRADGEALGLRLPVSGVDPPGRGWIARHDSLSRLQVALP